MKILWLSWKDGDHPLAGGAEVVNEQLARRLAADGNQVTFLVSSFAGAPPEVTRDGYRIIRLGNRVTVYWRAWRYYRRHFRGWADLVIDEVNTVPFFAKFYVREPNQLLIYMLCRRIWFYQLLFPLSLIGYLLEPVYLWLLRDRRVITISRSTQRDLVRFGFPPVNNTIIPIATQLTPVKNLTAITKYPQPTLLSLGAIRPMKRTLHQLRAFELAKAAVPDLQLKVAGEAHGYYGRRVRRAIARSRYAADITYLGPVSQARKTELLGRCQLILVTSVKEGWGLIVTEAASQGTPAVVYDVDGLRDSVRNRQTGLVTPSNPRALAAGIIDLLGAPRRYADYREAAWRWAQELTFDRAYQAFRRRLAV